MVKSNPISNTFDDLLVPVSEELSKIAERLREIIYKVHPETVEVIYLGYNSASYGIGPKKNSEAYCYIMPQKNRVNLGFYYGVDLDDPDGLLEGTGKKLRHIKVKTLADAENPALTQLVHLAVKERKSILG